MIDIETTLKQFPVISVNKDENLISQGETSDSVYFLITGDVTVIKDDVEIALTPQKARSLAECPFCWGLHIQQP